MFTMWKRGLTRGNSCPEFICADMLMEAAALMCFKALLAPLYE